MLKKPQDWQPDARCRAQAGRLPAGEATPSRAGLTLDPVDVTRQRNLAKFANSRDPVTQALSRLETHAKTLARRG